MGPEYKNLNKINALLIIKRLLKTLKNLNMGPYSNMGPPIQGAVPLLPPVLPTVNFTLVLAGNVA
jgi:hypothetical protein